MPRSIFLGGTVGTNTWREAVVIPGLIERGVSLDQIANPQRAEVVVDPAAKALVELHKTNATILLYTIALPYPSRQALTQISAMAIADAICGLYDDPARTVVMIDLAGMSTITRCEIAISVAKLRQRFPEVAIFDDYEKLLDHLAHRLVEAPEESHG